MSVNGAQFRGIVPPIVTPLLPSGDLDTGSLASLARWLIAEGEHGIWANGTNGEFACFSAEERETAAAICVEAAAGGVPVIVNIADCSTRLVIDHGKRAMSIGADAVAVTPPYYYANSQAELMDLFRAVRDAIDLPLFIYNIPSTVKVKVEVPTIVALAAEGTVVGIKDSQGDIDFARSMILAAQEKGAALRVLLGTRSLIDVGMLIGAHGAIPGISNVVPAACVETYEASVRGDWEAAAAAQAKVLAANTFIKTPTGSAAAQGMGGIKAALKAMGIIAHSTVAAPLHSPTSDEEATVARVARELGVLQPVPA